jgi:TatD DNase family protein
LELVDTHAHLADLSDISSVIGRAKAAGVKAVVAVAVNLETCIRNLGLAEEYPGYVIPALGIHPTEWFNEDVGATIAFIRDHISGCRAMGEIGLDYWSREVRRSRELLERQRSIYVELLGVAREGGLPASIHSRGAWRDALTLVEEHGPGRAVFHWYSGPADLLPELLDHDYYISCTPALEYSRELREAVTRAPLEHILIETDSPVYVRSLARPSEPADVAITLRHLAEIKGLPEDDVAEATTRNAETLFSL